MDGLLGGNWIGSGESIFYCLVQHLFAVFALRLIADLRYERLRFWLRFILRHFHRISIISAAVATLQPAAQLVPCKRQWFDHGDAVLHCPLYLLERTRVDLADALGRDAEFGGQVGKCGRVLGEPTRFKDAPLAIIEHAEHRVEGLAAIVAFVTRGERSLLVSSFINQPVLPIRRNRSPRGSAR